MNFLSGNLVGMVEVMCHKLVISMCNCYVQNCTSNLFMAGSLVFFQAELSLVIDANVWGGEQCLPSLKENRTFELAKTVKTSEGFLVMCYITCMLTVEMSNSST